MTAIEKSRARRDATVRLTPSSETDPFSTTKRESPGGIEKRYVQEFRAAATERRPDTPSTCPRTKWPESRSPHASALSRLTGSPLRRSPSVERWRVSPERSATKRFPVSIAVRQTPEMAMDSPSRKRPCREGGATVSLAPPRRGSRATTRPRPVTIPVNTRRSLQKRRQQEVLPDRLDLRVSQSRRRGQGEPGSADRPRSAGAAEEPRREKDRDPVHAPGAKESPLRRPSPFDEEACDSLAAEPAQKTPDRHPPPLPAVHAPDRDSARRQAPDGGMVLGAGRDDE